MKQKAIERVAAKLVAVEKRLDREEHFRATQEMYDALRERAVRVMRDAPWDWTVTGEGELEAWSDHGERERIAQVRIDGSVPEERCATLYLAPYKAAPHRRDIALQEAIDIVNDPFVWGGF